MVCVAAIYMVVKKRLHRREAVGRGTSRTQRSKGSEKERKKNPKERELIRHKKKRQEKWGKGRTTARNFYFAGGVRVIQQKKTKMTEEKASYLSRA